MALTYSGEVLAFSTRRVESRDGSFAAYDQNNLTCLDDGQVTELRCGRDFSQADMIELSKLADKRGNVTVKVFVSAKGSLFAESIVTPAAAAVRAAS